jgi:hypothetical protein
MKIAYLILLLLLCGAVSTGCLNLGTEEQAVYPSDSDTSRTLYEQNTGSGMASAPKSIASIPYADTTVDQKLIKTGSINLEVGNVPAMVDALSGIAVRHGGYLSSSSLSAAASDRMTATVVVRIPGEAFDAAVADIKALGTVRSASLNTQDVTEEYVDLQAQKTALQRQLDQYNRILEKAETVEEILRVQMEIGNAQTQLDRLEGRLRYLDNRVDLATITVYLQEPAPLGGETGHNFVAVINSGIQGFLGMIDTLIIAFFTFLPLIILGGIGYGVYRWRKGKKTASLPAPKEAEKQ